MSKHVADAIDRNFTSPNVPDSNLEPANLVDVIAGAGLNIAQAIRAFDKDNSVLDGIAKGLFAISESLNRVAEAIASKTD